MKRKAFLERNRQGGSRDSVDPSLSDEYRIDADNVVASSLQLHADHGRRRRSGSATSKTTQRSCKLRILPSRPRSKLSAKSSSRYGIRSPFTNAVDVLP